VSSLYIASHEGHVEVVAALLAKGADVETKTNVRSSQGHAHARRYIRCPSRHAVRSGCLPDWRCLPLPSPRALAESGCVYLSQTCKSGPYTHLSGVFLPSTPRISHERIVDARGHGGAAASWSVLTRPQRSGSACVIRGLLLLRGGLASADAVRLRLRACARADIYARQGAVWAW
jgi:hypothetical protein